MTISNCASLQLSVFQHLDSFWYNMQELRFHLKYKLCLASGLLLLLLLWQDLPFRTSFMNFDLRRGLGNILKSYRKMLID